MIARPGAAGRGVSPPPAMRRISTLLYLHPRWLLLLLLAPPLLWLGIIYLGSLFSLLLQSFFSIDEFSGLIVREFTLDTYRELFTPANVDIIVRTTSMAAAFSVVPIVIMALYLTIAKRLGAFDAL